MAHILEVIRNHGSFGSLGIARNIKFIVNLVSRLTREEEEREAGNEVLLRKTVSRTRHHEIYF